MVEIILPWAAKELSPNSRCHWTVKARAVKSARKNAFYATLEAGFNRNTFADYDGKIHLWIDCYAKTKNYPDVDNVIAALKGSFDGIADALDVDDKRFVLHPFMMDQTGGKVVIKLTKSPRVSS